MGSSSNGSAHRSHCGLRQLYMRHSLVSMSKRKFRKARSCINTILSEDCDEDEPPRVPQSVLAPAPASVRATQ